MSTGNGCFINSDRQEFDFLGNSLRETNQSFQLRPCPFPCRTVVEIDIFKTVCLRNKAETKIRHSSETSVIQTTDVILSAIDKKHLTAVVLLDMSKAFDSIDHNLLLVKFEDVGASPLATQWVCSYLTSRYEDVVIGTAVSERLQQVVYLLPWGTPLTRSIPLEHLYE